MRRRTAVSMVLALGLCSLAACLPNGVKDASKLAIWQANGLPAKATLLNRMVPGGVFGPKAEWSGAGPGVWTATAGRGIVLTARDAANGEAIAYTLVADERPASAEKGSPIRDFVVAVAPPHLVSDAEAAARRFQIFSDASEPAQAGIGGVVFTYTPAGAGYRMDAAPVASPR
ncbi:MAG: hypothetical protein QM608_12865 [Caulobacter sp.]